VAERRRWRAEGDGDGGGCASRGGCGEGATAKEGATVAATVTVPMARQLGPGWARDDGECTSGGFDDIGGSGGVGDRGGGSREVSEGDGGGEDGDSGGGKVGRENGVKQDETALPSMAVPGARSGCESDPRMPFRHLQGRLSLVRAHPTLIRSITTNRYQIEPWGHGVD